MTYTETLTYLYDKTPLYQHIGNKAYKPGLNTIQDLDTHFAHPHTAYRSIHVGGTNGKGSVSHSLAAILQSCGYTVGLYTSPHLKDFSERIRVNGKPIKTNYVVNFVEQIQWFIEEKSLSFFELTTMMAFCYFREQKVDFAIIEVGLGGRLDSTNIIKPILSVITNISYDHTYLLGNTLQEIAYEKAGIIKQNTPIVIGETVPETLPVFKKKASEMDAPIIFAEETDTIEHVQKELEYTVFQFTKTGRIKFELNGFCQQKNIATILTATQILQKECGIAISAKAMQEGLLHVVSLTRLLGRWQTLQHEPLVIADTAHNEAGIRWIVKQLESMHYEHLHIVLGMVNDKDISSILSLLPKNASYYFTQAAIQRAVESEVLQKEANKFELYGNHYPSVALAKKAALKQAQPNDLIYIGGSTFVVAEVL
ncbi:MAG: bifunctional folylpolyglutamate synthase/dihydrofolate synthase [Paludibacteraceae bacterium]|nr:bifunctional folylpolyglutamate synthase/dihydrofolate synthase [Paludibacteraceae bacterium]MBP6283943.1 bifunctional folylpolyglutamate synthase/dihydrofolate synthase [Paludibacteraceae bacterium]